MSGYTPPDILTQIATDRSEPYVHLERHRTRTRIRYAKPAFDPVAKTSYVTRDYILGSTQGGLIQPIQQHTWELFWATEHPHDGFNILFTIHPDATGLELGMFFPDEPELFEPYVLSGFKPTYNSPDKWTGASPHEQIVQHENSLIVLYDIPEGSRFAHMSGFFSKSLTDVTEDPSGWIFARGNRCLIAYRSLAPFEWREEDGGHRRLHSPGGKTGAVLHVDSLDQYGSMDAFRNEVLACEIDCDMAATPRARFRSPSGDLIEATYGIQPLVNGEPVDPDSWPLIESKFAAAPEPRVIDLTAEGSVHRLDFR